MADKIPVAHPGPLTTGKSAHRIEFDAGHPSRERGATTVDGAVVSMLMAGAKTVDVQSDRILDLVRVGLPFHALENLVHAVGASQQEVANAIGVPPTTLGRRRKSGCLTPVESDHVVRIARLLVLARELMAGDADAASDWLTTPHRLLGDEAPLRLAATETGGCEVEQLIGQLRHGAFG